MRTCIVLLLTNKIGSIYTSSEIASIEVVTLLPIVTCCYNIIPEIPRFAGELIRTY